jgi:hypothetical protein
MTAFEKARDFFMKKEAEYCEKAEEEDLPMYPLQLDETINLAIIEAKKEVFEDIEKTLIEQAGIYLVESWYTRLKEFHLQPIINNNSKNNNDRKNK